jgi:glycosyltransferase involved in cell wall biosynthesis
MRLLVDCHVFDGKYQGTRTYLEGLYRCLTQHKDITFYFAAHNLQNLKRVFGEGENISYVQLKHTGSLGRLMFDFPKIMKENDIDYAHFQYITPFRKSCKEIDTIHDLLFMDYPQYFSMSYRLKNTFFFKQSAKRADIVLSVSEYSRERINHWFDIPKADIHITENAVLPISNNIDIPDVKKKYGLDKYILTVSRIEPRKNHLMLLEAFVEMKLYDKGYKLVMIGTADLKYTSFQTYYNGLVDNIKSSIMIKSVSFPDLVGLYQNASLFVFPSLAEGFGIPPLEAIEYGCPVLCSNATAMKEFGLPQDMTFNPNDKEELESKMKRMLEKPIRFDKADIERKFNWKHSADTLYNVLVKDIHSMRTPPPETSTRCINKNYKV